jgi:hypothetical protein
MNRTRGFLVGAVASLGLSALAPGGCASTGAPGVMRETGTTRQVASTAGNWATQEATGPIASRLGVSQTYVDLAFTTARSWLGDHTRGEQRGVSNTGNTAPMSASLDDRQEAAEKGVHAAAVKAKADGNPLDRAQKKGLVDAIKALL